jgi:hypothetical protein
LRGIGGSYLLPLWFAIWAVHQSLPLLFLGGLGTDAEIYHRATVAWLGGGSPWDATSTWGGNVYHFYALPPSVVLMAPFALVPEQLFVPGFVVVQAGAALYVIRRLRLAWWWLLFPPVAVGIVAGNPSLLLLALLLAPHDILRFMAPTLKVYAILPLLGERRWRAVAIAALFGLASFVIAPGLWADFVTGAVLREARLMEESDGGYSAYRIPVLLPLVGIAVLALARYDLKAAGWLSPIALWPASQLHWSTLAMPVMTPLLAVMLAVDIPGFVPLAVALHVLLLLVDRVKQRRVHQPREG